MRQVSRFKSDNEHTHLVNVVSKNAPAKQKKKNSPYLL